MSKKAGRGTLRGLRNRSNNNEPMMARIVAVVVCMGVSINMGGMGGEGEGGPKRGGKESYRREKQQVNSFNEFICL